MFKSAVTGTGPVTALLSLFLILCPLGYSGRTAYVTMSLAALETMLPLASVTMQR